MVIQMVCWWFRALYSLYKSSSVTETQLMVLVESESSIYLYLCDKGSQTNLQSIIS